MQFSGNSNSEIEIIDLDKDPSRESDFFTEIEGSPTILVTSSPDKRVKFRKLFNCLESPHQNDEVGINAYLIDIGSLNIPPIKTSEKQGNYDSHAIEKAISATKQLQENQQSIYGKMLIDEAKSRPLVAMVEDSGWQLDFSVYGEQQYAIKQQYLENVITLLEDKFRDKDKDWLLNHIKSEDKKAEFPGPNVKPLQEAMNGSLNELMEIIYQAARQTDGMEADELCYKSNSSLAFGVISQDKEPVIYTKQFYSKGKIITKEQFSNIVTNLEVGNYINADSIHIPNGQIGDELTMLELKDLAFTKHSSQVPFEYDRRNFAQWLQAGANTKPIPTLEQKLNVAYVSASDFESVNYQPENSIIDLIGENAEIIAIPTRHDLRNNPSQKMLAVADIVILRGSDEQITEEGLIYDPNLMLVDYMVVNTETDPTSMTKPIILDNRLGHFNRTLRIYQDAFKTGRLMGELPFIVANNDEELSKIIDEQTKILAQVQLFESETPEPTKPIQISDDDREKLTAPNTVFIAGGHNNNSKQDKEEAFLLGYMLAKQNIRIVTGGGQIEGSMGSVHTGFIQYHLDKLIEKLDEIDIKDESLKTFEQNIKDGVVDAEELIEHHGDLINQLAAAGHIPTDMFYAYSTDALVKMESPNKIPTVGANYTDTINRIPRLDALLMPKTMIFMPGGVGTDEELIHAIKQQIERNAANDNGGEPLPELIIYNRQIEQNGEMAGQINGLLQELGIYDDDNQLNQIACDKYNIKVVLSEANYEKNIENITEAANNIVNFIRKEGKVATNDKQLARGN